MKVTIKDVAKEANVATSTVSRVLSNNPRISEETKERVNAAIKKLNYKPNPIARSLANNKTRILGVVLPNEADVLLANPFFINAMKGMSMYAQSKNYYITYAFSKNEETEAENIKEMTNSHLVDGVILLRVRENDESVKYLKEINFPFVVVGRPECPDEVLWVDNNNFQAMYKVVNKLIQNGHKKIGFVGAIKNLNMSKDRFKGYKKALEMNGIKYDENLVIHKDEFKEYAGKISCEELLENNDLTAIVTTDDLIAFGVMNELNNRKIKNIAVVGFNNTQLAQYQKPPLASVDINADKLGYQATKLLINALEGNDDDNRHYIVNTEFIERKSFI
ncbi:LacI family DNA-binding transcriptional regulator [Romboutsia sp.]|uniref:LacI family DNA-binding transcriptional regulator n=1 Tax=Romboutsia sp. TaxID=1965302 RepID=UPI002BEA0E0B|nr:LacI family DNA-binding transcriptional regulator [Romboutsia sp.]HSQ90489.1 LacI family DNA-binding transcriptional regulator [Romboutsia sp.]